MGVEADLWRRVARIAGLKNPADLPFLLWPPLWAAWLATGGRPDPWPLAALLLALLLARSALWSGFLPEATRLGQVWGERRVLVSFFGVGALCFALPLGAAGWLVPAALVLAAVWFQVRRRSYLSDPLLALALMLPPMAAWIAEGGPASKSAGLLVLAAALWPAAALVARPVQRESASLALLVEPHGPWVAGVLRVAALVALWLAGRQAHLGLAFLSGLGLALAVSVCQWTVAARFRRVPSWAWEAGWGAAVFAGLAVQLSWIGVGQNVP